MNTTPETPQDYGHPENASNDPERTHTERTAKKVDGVEVEPDVVSDPSLNDRDGSDWTDEGGATPRGPATSAPS